MGTILALLAFASGGLLLFVAAAGGGFAAESLGVPRVRKGVRLLSLLLGVVVIGLGLRWGTGPLDSLSAVAAPAAVRSQAARPAAAGAAVERHRLAEQVAVVGGE